MRNLRRLALLAAVVLALGGCQAATPPTPAPTLPMAASTPTNATTATPAVTPAVATPSPAMAGPTPLIVDTDLSVDDIVALGYVLGDQSLDVHAITVSG